MADKKEYTVEMGSAPKRICGYCGTEAPLVWVHGHGQCGNCGINIQECCQGETCQMD